MFKNLKNFFSRKGTNKKAIDKEVDSSLLDEEVIREVALPNIIEQKKKTILLFDKKKRIFITKIKRSTVALFCPLTKQFHIRQLDDSLKIVEFNPLGDDNFAYPLSGNWIKNSEAGIGLFYPKTGLTLFKNEIDSNNKADRSISIDVKGDYVPLVGNWNGDGIDRLCFYFKERSVFIFPENEGEISPLHFGAKGKEYIPISGDWNNSGMDSVGLYEPETSLFRLKNTLDGGKADFIFRFGKKELDNNLLPLSGNWEGNGNDSIALYDKETGVFRLKNKVEAGKADTFHFLGTKGLIPLELSMVE